MADSFGSLGARVVSMISCICPLFIQSLLEAMIAPVASASCRLGSASAEVTPASASDGPIALTITFFEPVPSPRMKPPIRTFSPLPAPARVEILTSEVAVGVALGVGLGLAVGDGVAVGLGVGVGVGGANAAAI